MDVQTGPDGSLNLTSDQMRGILALCSTEPKRAFLLIENVNHQIQAYGWEFCGALETSCKQVNYGDGFCFA